MTIQSLQFKDMETVKIMKAIKLVLIVFGLVSVLSLSAQTFAEQPSMQMHSTSAMMGSGSELPQAAISGVSTTYSSSTYGGVSGPKRIGGGDGGGQEEDPENPEDVYHTPLGDTPWLLMLLLALGYALRVGKKYGHQLPDAGK